MTFPIVTECSKALEPVDRDTFIEVADPGRAQVPAPHVRRRPAAA